MSRQRVAVVCTLILAAVILLIGLLHTRVSSMPHLSILQQADKHNTAEKHLVIASFTAQNVSWLSQVPSQWTVKRYMMDDPNPTAPNLAVPQNQGREAMAYLTYIIDNYDTLPDYVIFTHGHMRSWHQLEPLPAKIRALNLTALDDESYISLRCGSQMGCEKQPYIDTKHPNWSGEGQMCNFFQKVLPYEKCPRYVSYKCCAQHAVTRKAIQWRTKEDWIRIREPLMHDLKAAGVQTNWLGGMYYEKFWHVLFGMPPEWCPSVEKCQQVHFSNAIICDGDTDLTPFEGDAWEDTRCVSAFDGMDKEESDAVAIERFRETLLSKYAEIRSEASKRHKAQQEAWKVSLQKENVDEVH